MKQLISIDFFADFGFLKKPDTNDPIYITFNMLHKPTLLGVLGAIVGLQGFQQPDGKKQKNNNKKTELELDPNEAEKYFFISEYYTKLHHIQLGIKPLNTINGSFDKTVIVYNNGVGYANKDGGNLIIKEQTIINPAYRVWLLLDTKNVIEAKLLHNLKTQEAEFLPYLGKNEYSIYWKNFKSYPINEFKAEGKTFKICSIFKKEEPLKEGKVTKATFFTFGISKYIYFENLPTNYNEKLLQYEYAPFTYTDYDLKLDYPVNNLYQIDTNEIIQLF